MRPSQNSTPSAQRASTAAARELLGVELRVEAAAREQLGVGAALDDPRRSRRRGSRRRRGSSRAGARSRSSCAAGSRVSSACCTSRSLVVSSALVASSRMRIRGSFEQHPRDRQPLLLPAGEPVAALPHHGVVALGERQDPVVDVRRPRGGLQLRLGGVGLGVAQVVARSWRAAGSVSWVTMPIASATDAWVSVADVLPVDQDAPAVDVVEPRHQVGQRRLARAARPDDRGELPRLDDERHVLHRPPAVPVRGPAGLAARGRRTRRARTRPRPVTAARSSSRASGASTMRGRRSR